MAQQSRLCRAAHDYFVALRQVSLTLMFMQIVGLAWSKHALEAREYGVPAAIVLLLVLTTVIARDLWPFSHYPMFAGQRSGNAVRYFQLHFRFADGRMLRLNQIAETLADDFHRKLDRLIGARLDSDGDVAAIAIDVWRDAARLDATLREANAAVVVLSDAHFVGKNKVAISERKLASVQLPVAT